ncbi:MAG: UDP-N-acetylmuramate--L-alanine ligase [Deltaproteobacteria bacterium]|nr:UDP-N-acetylmuramate--L-alanine ligase [Deltaproteobacteria bacterium]
MYPRFQHIHFIGIGGIGMSGIAEVLLNLGYRVSGSDLKETEITRRLQALGGEIFYGHQAENIQGAEVVVTSSAVRPDNPEVLAARAALLPVIPRAEMLAELMRLKYGVAVAGAHGKTTTTSMVAHILAYGGLDPTVVIGGRLNSWGSNARLGQGSFLVAEADESDGSFLHLSPSIAIVTNIDLEHLDFYKNLDHIKAHFLDFLNRLPFYGLAILCLDDPHIPSLIAKLQKRYRTYGLTAQADLQAREVKQNGLVTQYRFFCNGKEWGEIRFKIPGLHNVYNSLAAIAVGFELEIPFQKIQEAFDCLEGVQRRFQIRGEFQGATVLDDYGHHPTEIRATLNAVRGTWPERRIIVVFQPHRYSRTKALFDEFTTSFYQADCLFLLPIYPAGEDPIEGINSEHLLEGIKEKGHRDTRLFSNRDEVLPALQDLLKAGDVLVTLGAGDVWKIGQEIVSTTGS